MKTIRILGIGLIIGLCAQAACAQTLREKIQAPHEARRSERMQERPQGAREPLALPAGTTLLRDIRYGDDPRQAMDVYLPHDAHDAPVMLMVHGGGWSFGDKAGRNVIANKVARWVGRGLMFISINNRLLPQADPLVQAQDVARALAYAQSHASGWGGDSSRFILLGHSAGAHLIALLSANPASAYALGAKPWLGSIALDSAALDVGAIMTARHLPLYDRAFGSDPDYWRSASPEQMLAANGRPLLAVCSTRREASCPHALRHVDKAKSLGVRAEVLKQNLSHEQINDELGLPGAYTQSVEAFMASLDGGIRTLLNAP